MNLKLDQWPIFNLIQTCHPFLPSFSKEKPNIKVDPEVTANQIDTNQWNCSGSRSFHKIMINLSWMLNGHYWIQRIKLALSEKPVQFVQWREIFINHNLWMTLWDCYQCLACFFSLLYIVLGFKYFSPFLLLILRHQNWSSKK